MKRWTQKELNFLQKNYGKIKVQVIAAHLNRTVPSIRMKAFDLNLVKEQENPRNDGWQPEEEQYLIDYYKKVPKQLICAKLGRNYSSVVARARKLGLVNKHWRPDAVRQLQKNIGSRGVEKMCEHFENT